MRRVARPTVGVGVIGLASHRRHIWKFGQRRIHVIPRPSGTAGLIAGFNIALVLTNTYHAHDSPFS